MMNIFKLMLTVKELKKKVGLHVTVNHSGKMDGMQSLSTSPYKNSQCNKNCQIDGAICKKCFSRSQMKMYTNQEKALAKNYDLLTSSVLPENQLPIINCLYFRFEAFGDLANENQVINYFNISKNNPKVNFTIWTKNPQIMKKAIDMGYEKPNNLTVIYSSLFINNQVTIEKIKNKYPFIDKVFTVYDKDYIKNNDIQINCGAKNCLKCRLCYEKNDTVYINEKLK